jgi:hypothetical protein
VFDNTDHLVFKSFVCLARLYVCAARFKIDGQPHVPS